MRSFAFALAIAFAPLAACAPIQAGLALAQEVSIDVTKAPAGAYKLDPTHTSVTWRVSHLGVSFYTARFDKIEGSLSLDPIDITKSSVSVTLDVGSVSTGLRNAQGELAFDKEIANTLGAPANPTATFVSTGIVKSSPTTGVITGNLTLNGITKPITLNASFGGGRIHPFTQRYLVGFSATGQFKRTDFGVNRWVGGIGDEVHLQIEAEFLKEQ